MAFTRKKWSYIGIKVSQQYRENKLLISFLLSIMSSTCIYIHNWTFWFYYRITQPARGCETLILSVSCRIPYLIGGKMVPVFQRAVMLARRWLIGIGKWIVHFSCALDIKLYGTWLRVPVTQAEITNVFYTNIYTRHLLYSIFRDVTCPGVYMICLSNPSRHCALLTYNFQGWTA